MGGGPCYQLAQSVLKIGSALLRKYGVGQGKVSECTGLADKRMTAVAWSALDGPFFCLLVQNDPFTL